MKNFNLVVTMMVLIFTGSSGFAQESHSSKKGYGHQQRVKDRAERKEMRDRMSNDATSTKKDIRKANGALRRIQAAERSQARHDANSKH